MLDRGVRKTKFVPPTRPRPDGRADARTNARADGPADGRTRARGWTDARGVSGRADKRTGERTQARTSVRAQATHTPKPDQPAARAPAEPSRPHARTPTDTTPAQISTKPPSPAPNTHRRRAPTHDPRRRPSTRVRLNAHDTHVEHPTKQSYLA